MPTMPKKTRGRQKVELKRIENEDALYVTFSKRKLSLFKKAAELATLCGAEIALVVFSPAGRPYSLGLPTVDEVFHRVLSGGPDQMGSQMAGHGVVSPSAKQCSEITKRLVQVKSRKATMDSGGASCGYWLKRWRRLSPRWISGSARSFSRGLHHPRVRSPRLKLMHAWPVGGSEGLDAVGPWGRAADELGFGFQQAMICENIGPLWAS